VPVRVEIEFPEDNKITLSSKFLSESEGAVVVRGRGNRLLVEDPFMPNTANLTLTGGASVVVRMDSNLNDLQIFALAEGVSIEVGAWSSFNWGCQITAHEPSTITIGAFCLFGGGCRVASSDVHKVLDLTTHERVNPPGDITIGEHVWLATGVTVLRNAIIGRDSVVGSGAVVRGAFSPNVSLAGIPARVVRTGITWKF
jgi:acetyltransferase-like isoleucine patch superfamily enzyme